MQNVKNKRKTMNLKMEKLLFMQSVEMKMKMKSNKGVNECWITKVKERCSQDHEKSKEHKY